MAMQSMRLEDGPNQTTHTQALNGLTGVAGVKGHGIMVTGPYLLVVLLLTQKAELSIHLVVTAQRRANLTDWFLHTVFRHSGYYKYLDHVLTYSPSGNSWSNFATMYYCKHLLKFIP